MNGHAGQAEATLHRPGLHIGILQPAIGDALEPAKEAAASDDDLVRQLDIGNGGDLAADERQGEREAAGDDSDKQPQPAARQNGEFKRPAAKKFPAPAVPDTEATDTKAREVRDSRAY